MSSRWGDLSAERVFSCFNPVRASCADPTRYRFTWFLLAPCERPAICEGSRLGRKRRAQWRADARSSRLFLRSLPAARGVSPTAQEIDSSQTTADQSRRPPRGKRRRRWPTLRGGHRHAAPTPIHADRRGEPEESRRPWRRRVVQCWVSGNRRSRGRSASARRCRRARLSRVTTAA